MPLKIYSSEPGFDEIDRLVTGIHQLTNPHLFQDLKEMNELSRIVALEELKEMLEEQLG